MSEWILLQSGTAVYVLLFLLLMSGALGFPPEDFSLLLGGIIAQRGGGDPPIIFAVCYLGTVLGDLFIFMVGRKFGPGIFKRKWVQSRLSPHRIKKIRVGLERRSLFMIFVARHLFYFRTITFLTCGAVKMTFMRFFVADAAAALVSVPLMLWLGFFASEHYERAVLYLKQAKLLSLMLAVMLVAGAVIYLRRRGDLESGADQSAEGADTLLDTEAKNEGK